MHIIDECPRCSKDFMYHQTDSYLHREVAWDADSKEPCSFETICQDCHLEEKWVGKEVKTNHPCFLHLNEFKLIVDGVVVGESHPLTVKIGDTDSYEWFDEEELEIVDNNQCQ